MADKDLGNTAIDNLDGAEDLHDVDTKVFNQDIEQPNGFEQKVPSAENSVRMYTSEDDTDNSKNVPTEVATGSLDGFGR